MCIHPSIVEVVVVVVVVVEAEVVGSALGDADGTFVYDRSAL